MYKCTDNNTTTQSYLCLMNSHYQLFIVFAKALSCLSLVKDGGKPRGHNVTLVTQYTHTLTHQTSLVMEEFLDSEVDNCSSSSFLYKKLSLLPEWLLWFCGSRRLDMSPKLPLISPSQLENIKWFNNAFSMNLTVLIFNQSPFSLLATYPWDSCFGITILGR